MPYQAIFIPPLSFRFWTSIKRYLDDGRVVPAIHQPIISSPLQVPVRLSLSIHFPFIFGK